MKKKRVVRVKKGRVAIALLLLFLVIGLVIFGVMYFRNGKESKGVLKKEKTVNLEEVKQYFSEYILVGDHAKIYLKNDNKYEVMAIVNGNMELQLDANYEIVDEYYKILGVDGYVYYQDISKIEGLSGRSGEYKYYANYIPWNENIVLKDNAKLYIDDTNYLEVSGGSYPIIVKDDGKYGVEYFQRLVYVNQDDVSEVVEATNTDKEITNGITVLNYHYTVSSTNENGEFSECRQSICITDTMFDSHIKYLKENDFYGASLRDLELYIDGKIRLPKKTVVVTIDDGWYVSRSIMVLNQYQFLGTLFLIGSLASPNDYISPYLEIHSHTWDMHKIGDCPSSKGHGGGILCLSEERVLEDLRKSRESLNNTPYFCYPFYEYNTRAINLLKQAGFRLAFAGESGDSKVHVGTNKYIIPRIVIINTTTMNQFIRYVN